MQYCCSCLCLALHEALIIAGADPRLQVSPNIIHFTWNLKKTVHPQSHRNKQKACPGKSEVRVQRRGKRTAGWSLTGKKKVFRYTVFPKKPAGTPCVQPWLVAVGGWRLAVGVWRLVAIGGWQLAVGGGWWWLAAVGGWRLVVGGGC